MQCRYKSIMYILNSYSYIIIHIVRKYTFGNGPKNSLTPPNPRSEIESTTEEGLYHTSNDTGHGVVYHM